MPKVIDDSKGGIGSTVDAHLTLGQFQSLHGNGWVLADGASCAGSAYAAFTGNTVVPDYRGEFKRGLDNGRGVDVARVLGTSQAHDFLSHTHFQDAHSHPYSVNSGGGPGPVTPIGFSSNSSLNTSQVTATNQNTGGTETRPRNVACNIFIRIN